MSPTRAPASAPFWLKALPGNHVCRGHEEASGTALGNIPPGVVHKSQGYLADRPADAAGSVRFAGRDHGHKACFGEAVQVAIWSAGDAPGRLVEGLSRRVTAAEPKPQPRMAALLGIVTPFCSCSAVPLFIGFVTAGVPMGVTFSFLISAPMLN